MKTSRKAALLGVVWLSTLLGVAQFVLIGLNWSNPAAEAYYWRPAALSQAVVAVVYMAVGSFVAWRRPDNIVGWLVALIGLGWAAYQTVAEYAVHTLLVEPGVWPLGPEAGVLTQITWVVPLAVIPVLLLVYPTGRMLSRRWAVVAVIDAVGTMLILLSAFSLWRLRQIGSRLLFIEEEVVDPTSEGVFPWGLLLVVTALLGALVAAVVRWRRAGQIERLQMQWLLVAGIILCLQSIVILTPVDGLPGVSVIAEVLLLLGLMAMPFAIAIAVLRYRLFEIERIISRTVTYGVMTALVVAFYLVTVFLLRLVVPAEGQLAVAGSTLATAALFNPVRRRVQAVVDRHFNREKYDAERVLSVFSGRLRNRADLGQVSRDLAETAQRTVQPSSISVWIRRNEGSPAIIDPSRR